MNYEQKSNKKKEKKAEHNLLFNELLKEFDIQKNTK